MNSDYSSLRDPQNESALRLVGDSLISDFGNRYAVVRGIPRFVAGEDYTLDFGNQWKFFAKTQLDSYTGLKITEERLIRCLGDDLHQLQDKLVLEAGSGAGRFTELLLKHGAIVHSFDYSSAVEVNAANNGHHSRLTLVQADLLRIPFARGLYDYVVCLGVLQHTPNPEEGIRSLWRMLRPGGTLVIDHYRWNLWLRLPPPLGDAEKLYRWFVLRLPAGRRFAAVNAITNFWFPVYWYFRRSALAKRVLARIAGIHFYYGQLPLRSREEFKEWSILDTHDGMTDHFKHYRTQAKIQRFLETLGAENIRVAVGGIGLEILCNKPA